MTDLREPELRGPKQPQPDGLSSSSWTWIAVAVAILFFVAVVFMWTGNEGQQQAEIPGAPPSATEQKASPPQTNPAPANTQPPQETKQQ